MGVNQINILSFIKNKKIYSDNTLEKYNYLFDIFISSEAFNNHGNLPKWLDILDSLPDLNTDFLDIEITIENNKFSTKSYDKRDKFKFPVNRFPHCDSNIHSKTLVGVGISQFLRIYRNNTNLHDFKRNIIKLLICMLRNGASIQLCRRAFNRQA